MKASGGTEVVKSSCEQHRCVAARSSRIKKGWVLKRQSCRSACFFILSTREIRPSHPSRVPLVQEEYGASAVYSPNFNTQGFYLFMRGRRETSNNVTDEEIWLPCVWTGLCCQLGRCWHHVNWQCPDHIWWGWEAAISRAGSWGTVLLWYTEWNTEDRVIGWISGSGGVHSETELWALKSAVRQFDIDHLFIWTVTSLLFVYCLGLVLIP